MQKRLAAEIDVSVQTLQDYSVMISDPDADACDPDEWERFMSQFGEVAVVTVHKNNGDLLHILAKRERILAEMNNATGAVEYVRMNRSEDRWLPTVRQGVQSMGGCRDLVFWKARLEMCDEIVDFLLKKQYVASCVFVTFEHEQGQRAALAALSTGLIQSVTNRGAWLPKNLLFRGENVLQIKESPEHKDIIYHRLGLSSKAQYYVTQFHVVCLAVFALLVTMGVVTSLKGHPDFIALTITW
jgi:hypothetical protein